MHRVARWVLLAGPPACVLGLSKLHAVVHGYDFSSSPRLGWALLLVVITWVAAYTFGFPDAVDDGWRAFVAALGAVVVSSLVISGLGLVVGGAVLPRAVVLGAAVTLVPWFVTSRSLARDGASRAEQRDRVFLVADDDDGRRAEDDLAVAPERPATLVGRLGIVAASSVGRESRPLIDAAREARANVVVLSRDAQTDPDVVEQAAVLHADGVRVRTLSLFYEQWLAKLPVSELERVSLLFDIGEVHAPNYARVKRIVDVLLAAMGTLVLVVVTPVVVVGNGIANRGSLLFRQTRVGRGGAPFVMLKFRTMVPATAPAVPGLGGDWTAPDDPRITGFGRLLRRTHLDELPQVLNVLRGELSIVGPRPEQPQLVVELAAKVPFYSLRHLVRPGLTGWAQVKYPYAGTDAETLEKLQYEFFYLRRQSLGLDLRIVARTVRSVIGREGR